MKLNRFQMQQQLEGFKAEMARLTDEYDAMLTNPSTTKAERDEKKAAIDDINDRFNAMKGKLEALDAEEAEKMKAKTVTGETEKDRQVSAMAGLIRDVMANKPVSQEYKAMLGDNSSTGGSNFLPKTVLNEIITPAMAKNPLRGVSAMTQITNLEIPRVAFTLSDDDFIADGATAKELAATGDMVSFGRNKFKVFCDISETVLNGTDTNLVATVEEALKSGLAKKEKKIAFATTPATGLEHASFYNQTVEGTYDIKEVTGASLFHAIKNALADLEDDYAENASIVMTKAAYFDIIESLSNGTTNLYAAQPEQILGAPVVFCDLATIPVVGDFSYSHFNYDEAMLYDHDKNVKTGIESFVLTAWIDHQIKLKAAFRLAKN